MAEDTTTLKAAASAKAAALRGPPVVAGGAGEVSGAVTKSLDRRRLRVLRSQGAKLSSFRRSDACQESDQDNRRERCLDEEGSGRPQE
jgi:hypothetical protein